MIYQLPFDSTGSATVNVTLNDVEYQFHTYFLTGQYDCWALDIVSPNGDLVAAGVKLVPGSASVVHGLNAAFDNRDLFVLLDKNTAESVQDSLGSSLIIYWLSDAETDRVFELPDPLSSAEGVFGG